MDSDDRPPRQAPPTAFVQGVQRPARLQQPTPSYETSKSSEDPQSTLDPQLRPPLHTLPYGSSESTSRVQFSSNVASESSRANLLASTSALPQDSLQPGFSGSDFKRKKSLVRPDRERIDENHRLYNYRKHAAQFEAEGRGVAAVSRTGHTATAGLAPDGGHYHSNEAYSNATNLRRGKSILAREEGMANETGLSMFKRGATLRRPNNKSGGGVQALPGGAYEKRRMAKDQKEPLGPWMLFCLAVTICCPSPLLKCFGLRTKDRQNAWREKIGLLCIIAMSMAFVGFLTFGFTESVCGTPALRYKHGDIEGGSMIFHGYDYDLNNFSHPAANGIEGGTNPLYTGYNTGGMDGSFLFQTVNEKCLDVITPAAGTGITNSGNKLGWYFPCNVFNQWGTSAVNLTDYSEGTLCHTQSDARTQFAALKPLGQVYFEWADLKNTSRNLGVYDGAVLDFNLLNWLDKSQVSYPAIFDEIKTANASFQGRDITQLMVSSGQRAVAECMIDTLRVGFIDSVTLGCVASDIVLYVSLVVIIGVVVLRFFMAVLFGWFLSWKIGKFPDETYEQRRARAAEIENWTDDIYRPAPARYRPNAKAQKKSMLPKTSRFTKGDLVKGGGGANASSAMGGDSKYGEYRKSLSMTPSLSGGRSMLGTGMRNSPPDSPGGPAASRSSTSLPASGYGLDALTRSAGDGYLGACPFPPEDVVPQPPADFQPFNYPLAHTILLVTAYSESVEGLRTTLDSLATTDYPNSHKVILVIADGMVKGSGNSLTTPEIVLGMMKELVVPSEDVEALSYVAIADGHKRHNMAKVYAGFYEYDNNTVEMSKQQRVPMMLVAKVGNPSEMNDAKPGNRGKRDSQIVLMSFLQKVMFDERMTTFEYEFFNSMWRCTGVSPDRYETVLMVDADTKIFPDSVSRMVACMVHDPEIMGLCGETKIANKSETWVTMIQVFEYYVSHHLTKAFESMFGGVTCLPGCFSMYRIKSPKGGDGYWVPVLANPDIVMHYSENVVDTLHKKNLLLLGEDRYLTTLMLRTFPRRKMMFCPQAVCKTVVPDTFSVLLSQRRRWINSTVHNLFELFVVPDLCGVFCFSMRFVIFMELAGTLVLPAAIAFTLYLIVVAIIPGTVKPVLSLILLAIILGIPAVLIVVTSRKVAYLGWMLIYLMSLPIWNFVLPFYAFLHMDDFSWGQTRKIVGDDGAAHTDKDGVFDSSHIVMKRWADFERDRRYKSGNHSRDSTYDIIHRAGSPQRSASNRYSVVSSADTYASLPGSGSGAGETFFRRSSPSDGGFNPSRYPATLELPAPLAAQRSSPASSTSSIPQDISTPPELPSKSYDAHPQQAYEYPRYAEGYDSDELEREAILVDPRGVNSPPMDASPFPAARDDGIMYAEPESLPSAASRPGRSAEPSYPYPSVPRSSSVSPMDPNPSRNPFTSAQQQQPQQRQPRHASKPRGVSLVDSGPVAGAEGMRVVQRARRTSSQQGGNGSQGGAHRSRNSLGGAFSDQQPPTSPTSVSSGGRGSLPPGAAPPRHSMQ